jgi:predicted XRE-type DNA-binding protein
VSDIVTGALLAMGGAVASQAAGIATVVASGRRRQHDAATRRAAELEAKRRRLYEELLATIHQARLYCAEASEAVGRLSPRASALGGLAEGLLEQFDSLRTVAVAVMIDGSARASQTATTIAGAIRERTPVWRAVVKRSEAESLDTLASQLSDVIGLLGKAERELVAAARADLGVPD